jgi:hypothetical protein
MRRLGSGVFAIAVAAITLGHGRSQASPEGCQVRVSAVTSKDGFLAGWLSWWFARWRS